MSNKCKLVDQTTFELMQQSTSNLQQSSSGQKVRNAKYKRMTANEGFDLSMFIKRNESVKEQNKKKIFENRRRNTDNCKKTIQKKGKIRENPRVVQSKLKKAILRYRQNKNEEGQASVVNTTGKMQDMAISAIENSEIISRIHSRRFREYCNTSTTPNLQQSTEELLRGLNFFQRRAYAQNEIKAQGHRRFVVGFRQVQAYLKTNKVRLVIIATDCEKCEGDEGGLDQTISNIKTLCQNQNVPVAFPFERRKLAYILFKKASISCIGILDYDGARETFAQLLLAINEARQDYEDKIRADKNSLPNLSDNNE